jgi:drug/metabolite transporter (DMT)-like permease
MSELQRASRQPSAMKSRRSYALAGVIVLMIVWGSTFVVTKSAVHEIPPLTLAALRFVIAACVLVPLAVARWNFGRLPAPFPLLRLVGMGLTGIAMFHVAFNYALAYGSASQGALIFALIPAAVGVAAVVGLKESPSKRRVAGIVLSVCGVALVAVAGAPGSDSPRPLLGALWMLGAVAAWAVYTVMAKQLADADQVVVIAWATVVGAVVLMPLAAFELAQHPWPRPSTRGWLGALFLGVVASALAFVVYSRALRELDASLMGVFLNLDPIVGVLTAFLFLGETLGAWQGLGGAIALTGMWLASTDTNPHA